jgi:hypothetical protein
MNSVQRLVLLSIFALVTCVLQQPIALATNPQTGALNPSPQGSSVRILTPSAGQNVTDAFIEVRYELIRPALSGSPTFLVQLDASDPVQTSETSQTFSDLQPGNHTVRVTLVDANNSPVQGGSASVQFKIAAPAAPARDDPRGALDATSDAIAAITPSVPVPSELLNGDMNHSTKGSPLPLLSLIGFGLLIGGAARTMRAR